MNKKKKYKIYERLNRLKSPKLFEKYRKKIKNENNEYFLINKKRKYI